MFDRHWRLVATPGYHKPSEIFYDGPIVRPTQKTPLLDRLLREFCWKADADRVNYLGMLVTAVTMNHWIGKHPLAIFNSNMPRLGKSLLARLLALLTDGSCATVTYIPNDEEFERQLATRVEEGDRVVIIDNAKHSQRVPEVSSGVLERCVTDETLNFRRLRTNTTITRPNDVIFCLTMNTARLSPDLRHRGLPINLHWEGDVRNRHFDIPDPGAFVAEHRFELIAELLGIVRRWLRAGQPIPKDAASHSVSNPWAATMDGILRVNGYDGFLSNFDESEQAFDVDHAAVAEVCAELYDRPRQTAGKWAEDLMEYGLWSGRLCHREGRPKPKKAWETIVGTRLKRFTGARFDVEGRTYALMRTPATSSHVSPQYWFELVRNEVKS
ncbi:MAG: hypothetical protein IIA44_14965 [Acidobacteria bacterium]|nr:hypothetical protein [Acidobacteriota bacterium]